MNYKRYVLWILFTACFSRAYSQEKEYTDKAIKIGIGLGLNDTRFEKGFGPVYSVGYQMQFSKSDRLRINPNLVYGGFTSEPITDTRDQFYRVSALGVDLHGDVVRLNSFSFVLTFGAFMNYSRGLMGTGGDSEIPVRNSSYFYKLYTGTKMGVALRFVSKNKAYAYEFKPISLLRGNQDFTLGYLMFGMDINLRK